MLTQLPSLKRWFTSASGHRIDTKTYQESTRCTLRYYCRGRSPALVSATASLDAKTWSLYDQPELFDAAFGFRNFAEEAQFLEAVFERSTGRQATSFLELGCGAANHAVQLAQRGHKVYALDASRLQLQYAAEKAKKAEAAVHFLRDDMCNFELPDDDTVDVAMLLLGTLSDLQSHKEVQECWMATQQALKPGGLLVMEVIHPEDVFDGAFVQGEMWEAPLVDGQEVIMEYGTDDDLFDVETQVLRKRVGVSVRKGDAIDLQGEGFIWQRVFTLQELLLLAESVGLEVAGTYGDFNLDIDLGHEQASRLVLVLQKPSENASGGRRQ